ncbi:MAG: dockerin type I domain-containing protein, partial [Planctomycetota bacterium]
SAMEDLRIHADGSGNNTLVFTPENWNRPQSIVISAIDDNLVEGIENAQLTIQVDGNSDPNWNGVQAKQTSIQISDNDSVAEENLVAVDLETVDTIGNPIEQIEIGDRFYLQMRTRDLRDVAEGVFSVYADLNYDANLVRIDGQAEFHDAVVAGNGDFTGVGVVDDLGGVIIYDDPDNADLMLTQIPFVAIADGFIKFQSQAAGNTVGTETLLLGQDGIVDAESIQFGQTRLTVVTAATQWHNTESPLDVSGDGQVTPIDALQVINFMNRFDGFALRDVPGHYAAGRQVDVNDDGRVSAIDALMVINEIAQKSRLEYGAGEFIEDNDRWDDQVDASIGDLF